MAISKIKADLPVGSRVFQSGSKYEIHLPFRMLDGRNPILIIKETSGRRFLLSDAGFFHQSFRKHGIQSKSPRVKKFVERVEEKQGWKISNSRLSINCDEKELKTEVQRFQQIVSEAEHALSRRRSNTKRVRPFRVPIIEATQELGRTILIDCPFKNNVNDSLKLSYQSQVHEEKPFTISEFYVRPNQINSTVDRVTSTLATIKEENKESIHKHLAVVSPFERFSKEKLRKLNAAFDILIEVPSPIECKPILLDKMDEFRI